MAFGRCHNKNNIIEIWVDGILRGHREDYPNPQSSTNSNYYIGGSPLGSYFEGLIGNIKIYNASLSSSQVKQEYVADLYLLLNKKLISKEEYFEKVNNLAPR